MRRSGSRKARPFSGWIGRVFSRWPIDLSLALTDCRQAMKLEPGMMRARIQTGEALQDLGLGEEAAKLNVSYDLARDENKHVNEGVLTRSRRLRRAGVAKSRSG